MNSFIPTMIHRWNNLDDELKYIGNLHLLKTYLKRNDKKVPAHYYAGNRSDQISLARLRMGCSNLRKDLFDMHIVDDPSCECGADEEDASHFFFDCPMHQAHRHIITNITYANNSNIHNLLFGDDDISQGTNFKLMETVANYINSTGRFRN